MEQHIEKVIGYYESRRNRRLKLEQELVDSLDSTMHDHFRKMLQLKESHYLRRKRARMSKKDFKKIKKIGEGGYGVVALVRLVDTSRKASSGLYAMKTLRKSHVVDKGQVAHVMAEKDILAEADNEWIVKLFYSFQVRA